MARLSTVILLVFALASPAFAQTAGSEVKKDTAKADQTAKSQKAADTGQAAPKSQEPAKDATKDPSKPDPKDANQAGAATTPPKPDETKELVQPLAKIVSVKSDGSQITTEETFSVEISTDLKAALEKLTAGSGSNAPILRRGELVCLRINDKQVAETQGCNCVPPCSDPASKAYTFEGLGPDADHVQLGKAEQPVIDVPDGVFREKLKDMGIGSTVSLKASVSGDKRTLQTLEVPRIDSGAPLRFILIVVTVVVLFVLAGLAWGWSRRWRDRRLNPGKLSDRFRPLDTFLGKDCLYSSSKFQAALWFALLIVTYVPAYILRWRAGILGGLSIPNNLLMMSGLSVITFAGAKAIKQSQATDAAGAASSKTQQAEGAQHVANAASAALEQADPQTKAALVPQAAIAQVQADALQREADAKQAIAQRFGSANRTSSFWYDLTHDDDGTPSLSKFQLVVIVLLAVVLYAIQAWDFLGAIPMQANVSLPDVDKALLTAFGLGQGAYLGVKFAGNGQAAPPSTAGTPQS
jgi:hypothetical protein